MKIVEIIALKGSLSGFGEDILIRRERSSLAEFLSLNKQNKQTDLKGHNFIPSCFFIFVGSCYLSSFKKYSGDLIWGTALQLPVVLEQHANLSTVVAHMAATTQLFTLSQKL